MDMVTHRFNEGIRESAGRLCARIPGAAAPGQAPAPAQPAPAQAARAACGC